MTTLSFLALVTYCGVLVQSETTSFSCCPSPQIRFDKRCEHLWVIDGMTVALFKEEKRDFIAPIKELKDDLMVLEKCVDVNVTVICMNNGVAEEQRIRYHGDPCPTPVSGNTAPGNQGCVPLLLLLLLAALVLVLF